MLAGNGFTLAIISSAHVPAIAEHVSVLGAMPLLRPPTTPCSWLRACNLQCTGNYIGQCTLQGTGNLQSLQIGVADHPVRFHLWHISWQQSARCPRDFQDRPLPEILSVWQLHAP
jgi:hypothetical protein